MLRIGSLQLQKPHIMAPMAGITDLPFRLLNRSFGCEFAFTEMISADACARMNRRTARMLARDPADRPLGVQLLGKDPDILVQALDRLEGYRFDLIDLNAACPVKKVVSNGEGSALMRDRDLLGRLLRTLVKHARVPVTVKIRAGWNDDMRNAVEIAVAAQDAGVSAVMVHGRTRRQGYAGAVDYGIIADVKRAVRVPVIGSGDVLSAGLAKTMIDETGCDGVAVARGCLGNPWIFRELDAMLLARPLPERPTADEISETMTGHYLACRAFCGDRMATVLFRKFFAWYVRGFPDACLLRAKGFEAETPDAMLALFQEFRKVMRQTAA